MTISRYNQHFHFSFAYTIYQPMLLCQLTTPPPFRLSLQRFRVAKTCPMMFAKLTKQTFHIFRKPVH